MPHAFEEVIDDPLLLRELDALIQELGGYEAFDFYKFSHGIVLGSELDFHPRILQVRRSPVQGRYSVTLTDELGYIYHRFKWEPTNHCLYSVIPWRAIKRRWDETEEMIRMLVNGANEPRFGKLLRGPMAVEAMRKLLDYGRMQPQRACQLAEELGVPSPV
jgi:hypothetical protein